MLRVIGDVHGKQYTYAGIANKSEFSVCVGDVGFDYTIINRHLDPAKHRIVAGNHDNYDKLSPHFLSNSGECEAPFSFKKFFFIRGALSIDKARRLGQGIDWWEEEELDFKQTNTAMDRWAESDADFVVTHECPTLIQNIFLKDESRPFKDITHTAVLLNHILLFRRPKVWVFGHWHRSFDETIEGTRFICLDELEHKDFE